VPAIVPELTADRPRRHAAALIKLCNILFPGLGVLLRR